MDLNRLLAQARQGGDDALGRLLELYRNYVKLLADLQINRRLQGKVSASDIVQETFLQAKRAFPQFRGTSEGELVVWLRQILASQLAMLFRHYSTQKRDNHLEHRLDEELNHSSKSPPDDPPGDPKRRSLANTIRALRSCLNNLRDTPEPGQDLFTRLRQAVTDNNVRKSSKRSRYRPPNPDKKQLGDPKLRKLTKQEKKQLNAITPEKLSA